MSVRVSYLFGAGASEGELKYGGTLKSILMRSIQEEIAFKIANENIEELKEVRNDLVLGVDIEQLITLYEFSGTKNHSDKARRLKELFRKAVEDRIRNLDSSFSPTLFASLIDMHSIKGLNEQLVSLLTTNYEDLIEKAMQKVKKGINYVFRAVCECSDYCVKENIEPILKLHGSFNWKNEYPVTIQTNIENEEEILWIPPGVVKKREFYPFNIIWGKAKELLECDILRIIGSSLSRNDWDLVSLIFTTQRLRTDYKPPYIIELIDYPDRCKDIRKEYGYLRFKTILEIEEIKEFIVRNYFIRYLKDKKPVPEKMFEVVAKEVLDKENIFSFWLRAKGEKLYYDGIPLTTKSKYFENFVKSELGVTYGKD